MSRLFTLAVAVGLALFIAERSTAGIVDYVNGLPGIVSDDFTGYGVGAAGAPNGPTLNGNGLGSGFSGVWSGSPNFLTDDAHTQGGGPGNPGQAGTVPWVVMNNSGGQANILRPMTTGLPMPTGDEYAEFALSFRGSSETISGRYGHGVALLDSVGGLLAGVSFDGNGSPVGRFKMYDSTGPNAAADFVLAPEKQWHHVIVRGLWQSDGSADLFLYVDPDGTTGINDYGATLSINILDDLSQLQVRSGDFNSVSSGKAIWDSIQFRGQTFAPIPEPATLTLLILGALLLPCPRRRHSRAGPS